MDWDAFRYFLAVADTGSLSAAARALAVSQPTVGRQVQVLEQALNVRLFDRRPDGYAMTEAGQGILELVRDIDGAMAVIERQVGGENGRLVGKVRITAAQGLGTYWLPAQIHRLAARYPDIGIELSVCVPAVDLARHQADIAIRLGDPGDDSLIGRRVARAGFGLFAADSYIERRGAPRRLADLAGHDVIESTGEIANLPQARILRDHTAGGRGIRLACDNLLTQFAAMVAGCGLLALPLYMAAAAPGIRRVLADSFDVETDLWLLTHRDHKKTARVRAVAEHLCASARRDQGLFLGR